MKRSRAKLWKRKTPPKADAAFTTPATKPRLEEDSTAVESVPEGPPSSYPLEVRYLVERGVERGHLNADGSGRTAAGRAHRRGVARGGEVACDGCERRLAGADTVFFDSANDRDLCSTCCFRWDGGDRRDRRGFRCLTAARRVAALSRGEPRHS